MAHPLPDGASPAGPLPPGRLGRRLFLYFAATLLALAIGVAMATSIPLLGRLTQCEENGLAHLAATKALAVGEWFHRAEDLTRQINSRTQIRDVLEEVRAGRMSPDAYAAYTRPRLIDAMKHSGDVVGITRLSAAGAPLVSCGAPPYPSAQPWYPLTPPNLPGEHLLSHANGTPFKYKCWINWTGNVIYGHGGLKKAMDRHLRDPGDLPLIIGIDTFHNETNAYADYLVPDPCMYEVWGAFPAPGPGCWPGCPRRVGRP